MFKYDELRNYLNEFLSTRKENIIPLAEFRKFLRSKGLHDKGRFSSSILRLSAYGDLYLYRDVTERIFIIKDPSKFNEKEFLLSTKSTASRIYTFILTLIDLQSKNPNMYINTRTIMAEYRKKYPHLYYKGNPIFRLIKTALHELGYLEYTGTLSSKTANVRLTDEFMKKYGNLTLEKFKQLLREMQPIVSKSKRR